MRKKKAKTRARKGKPIRQIAALPYRRDANGAMEFMVVTSRATGRFILPKGWPVKGMSDPEAAAEEAEQEAGVVGRVNKHPIGRYRYWKRLADAFVPITVTVYPLEVKAEASDYREQNQRARGWLQPEQAELLIDDPELKSLLREASRILEDKRNRV